MKNIFKKSLYLCILFFVLAQQSIALNTVRLNLEYFPNPTIGRSLSNANIYIGEINLDPEVPANQKQISVLLENGSVVNVSQPITTSGGGVPEYNGSPVTILVDGEYSLKVNNSSGSQIYYVPRNASDSESFVSISSIADLRSMAYTPNSNENITVLGYYSEGDGGGGQFYWDSTSTETDDGGTIIKASSIADGRWKRLFDGKTVYPEYFGAIADGVTDSTVAIQSALDYLTNGGVLLLKQGKYLINRNPGTNDVWGVKITNSDITIRGDNTEVERYDIMIGGTAYSTAYPLFFVGTPDSDVASPVTDIIIDGVHFIGDDVRHNVSGSHLTDFRNAITFKNTDRTTVKNCVFTKIDSAAIEYQKPASRDYVNGVYYNYTKNYNAKIINNTFIAEAPAASAARSLIHTLQIVGVDYCGISNNIFKYCDVAVNGETTYEFVTQTEDDTYTDIASGFTVRRTCRDFTISNNKIYNSPEHSFYTGPINSSITGNVFSSDSNAYQVVDHIKINGKHISISGNIMSGKTNGISIAEPSDYISIVGNTITTIGNSAAGAIDVSADNIKSNIDNRGWLSNYIPMGNISIIGNTITLPEDVQTGSNGSAIRIQAAATDATNFPDGSLQNITISGNTIKNHRFGVYLLGTSGPKSVNISGNTFRAKPFDTVNTFTTGTTMNTEAPLGVSSGSSIAMLDTSFTNNYVYGSKYLWNTTTGTGTSVFIPRNVVGNRLDFIQYIRQTTPSTPMQSIGPETNFSYNYGRNFLDHSSGNWSNDMIGNHLGDATGSSNSLRHQCFQYSSATGELWFFKDDAGTKIVIP